MTRHWIVVIAVAVSGLLAVVGCGESADSAEEQFLTEMYLVIGSFTEIQKSSDAQVKDAASTGELERAYASYADELSKQKVRMEDVETPEACEDEREALITFMDTLINLTEGIADQQSLGPNAPAEYAEEAEDARSDLKAGLVGTFSKDEC